MADRASLVGGATHPFFDDCNHSKVSLLGLLCKCHHIITGPSIGGSKGHEMIRHGIFGWLLHLWPCMEHGGLLEPEVLLDGIQDFLAKSLCHLLFASSLDGQPA